MRRWVKQGPESLWAWVTVALAVVLVAVVATSAVLALVRPTGARELEAAAMPWRPPGNELTERSRQVAEAARELTLAFMEVDHRNMEPLMDRVVAGATGTFKEQYEAQREELVEQAKQNNSVSSGEVVALGIGELDADSAQVFVAANSEVRNRSTEGTAQPRYYRLQLDMVRQDGEWLVSDVRFVG